jgi:ribosomal protein L34
MGHYSLAVWSRTHGFLADVTSVSTPSESAILRSRRE